MGDSRRVIIVKQGHAGDAMVTFPSGQVKWMTLWVLLKFAVHAIRQGYEIEVQDA